MSNKSGNYKPYTNKYLFATICYYIALNTQPIFSLLLHITSIIITNNLAVNNGKNTFYTHNVIYKNKYHKIFFHITQEQKNSYEFSQTVMKCKYTDAVCETLI